MLSYKGRCHRASEICAKFPPGPFFSPKDKRKEYICLCSPSLYFEDCHWVNFLKFLSWACSKWTECWASKYSPEAGNWDLFCDCLRWHLSVCTELSSMSVAEIKDGPKRWKGQTRASARVNLLLWADGLMTHIKSTLSLIFPVFD